MGFPCISLYFCGDIKKKWLCLSSLQCGVSRYIHRGTRFYIYLNRILFYIFVF